MLAVAVPEVPHAIHCPQGKVPFATHDEARRWVRGQRGQDRGELIPYTCRECGWVHLTSMSRAKYRRMEHHHG
jgi:RNase P subunit RPR2